MPITQENNINYKPGGKQKAAEGHGNTNRQPQYGLSTCGALSRLHDEIAKILSEYEREYSKESWRLKLCSAFMKRYDSPLGWFAIVASVLTIGALFIANSYLAATCLLVILSLDLYVVVRENNLRRTEVYRKARFALGELKLAEQELCNDWNSCNYPHLCCPMSPCVSLQHTYRDGVIVNLPWALLVRGDYIVLRPGHVAPGPCTEIGGKRSFYANEIYGVSAANDHPPAPVKPMARTPLPDLICCLDTTPYLENLRVILEKSLKRPPTIYNQQRFLLVSKYIQQWGFMSVLCLTIFISLLRIYGIGIPSAQVDDVQHYWKHIVVESSVAAVIPLLPLIFPIIWISMNLWGIARLQCFLKTPQLPMVNDLEKSFEEDLDTPTYEYENVTLLRSNVFRNWLKLWKGDSELLPRSANVVQVLGSITALCCVDKKGILSWPNPTAEKVFFLHDTKDDNFEERSNSQSSGNSGNGTSNHQHNKESDISAEVLDLTHDQHCPFRLEFDDHDWKTHIKSLKPLGLAILLNTCSSLTHSHYAQFCGHVTAVAMADKDLVPVTNRRCLCELAKQIGFTDHATDRFQLEGQLASYRHLQPDVVRRDIRFARQLQLSSKVKVPFPHSLSVVMRENPGGYLSLFTQGTADIVLDCCDDFWDGKDLRPLSHQDRKRALDFYQRSALTAYCTAFAYRPLRYSINGAPGATKQCDRPIAYLELPPESKIRIQHVDKGHCDFECEHVKLSHSISTDSLLFSESKDDDISNVESCFEMQCHQVFIGMVTMQYQAQTDIVQLVERLERACIRFVHFSKDNELRSRVFSEKMGLESGWNCHISLMSETDAKSALNVGANVSQSPKSLGKLENTNRMIKTKITESTHANISTTTTTTTTTSNTNTNRSLLPHSKDITCIPTTINSMSSLVHPPLNAHNVSGAKYVAEPDSNCLVPPANLETTKTLSSSAPGAISNNDYNMLNLSHDQLHNLSIHGTISNASTAGSQDSLNLVNADGLGAHRQHRQSQDSAMVENCRSLSILTESTEQSAPVHFDMSNRAKLPRGIENIRPHLEKVDNVPLQVSLFTDCSAEATQQMLDIMQCYGEIVVCLGSSASNSNADIFLQADCSIAVEPFYPQVCQNIPAYTEANILNNKLRLLKMKKYCKDASGEYDVHTAEELLECGENARPMQPPGNTVSPIYLSRLLNSLPCCISVSRDDPLSIVAIIELSRRFSSGLWNCIQYWACCAGSISTVNILSACLSLPPILTPLMVIYLMVIPVPLIALALAHIDVDPKIMNRATGKKQTEYDSRVFIFVVWCYGCKFFTPILITILSYCAFMAHPIEVLDVNEDSLQANLYKARVFSFLGIILHFVVISASFVHRDHMLWRRNPFRNRIWLITCLSLLVAHVIICAMQVLMGKQAHCTADEAWPAVVFLYTGSAASLLVSEIIKSQEIKVNARYQRRARLDFGTKLGMNSPF